MDSNNLNQNQQDYQHQDYGQQGYQQGYQQPLYQQPMEVPVTMGEWLLTIFLMLIPCVNIILLFVWAFSGSTAKSKSNWAKAQLIWVAISIILTIIFYAIFGAVILSALNSY